MGENEESDREGGSVGGREARTRSSLTAVGLALALPALALAAMVYLLYRPAAPVIVPVAFGLCAMGVLLVAIGRVRSR